MIDAITQCPACRTSFRVSEAQLRIAEGAVRCGNCLHVFQAEDHLLSPLLDMTEQLAIEQDYWRDFNDYLEQVGRSADPASVSEIESSEPEVRIEEIEPHDDVMIDYLAFIESHPGVEPSAVFNEEPSAVFNEEPSAAFNREPSAEENKEPSAAFDEEPSAEENKEPSAALDKEPSAGNEKDTGQVLQAALIPEMEVLEEPFDFEVEHDPDQLFQDKRRIFRIDSLKWVPGIILLLGGLGIQWVFLNLETYSQDHRYREQLQTVCRVIGCEVPDYDSLEEIRTRELIIRSHPEVAGALMVDVLLRNNADFRQQFPGLRLEFMDVRGNVVASRTFRADEYLGGEMRGLRYIPALTEVRLSLEIADPGENALGYQMEVVRI